jgi:uncharacterized surface protein with fasciclin (FAS1) repeats
MFTVPSPLSTTLAVTGLTSLYTSLTQAGLSDTLDASSSVTFFAPSNEALLAASNTSSTEFFQAHIVPSFVGYLPLLTDGAVFLSQAGTPIQISIRNGEVFANDAKITGANSIVGNGVVHVIDKVSFSEGYTSVVR